MNETLINDDETYLLDYLFKSKDGELLPELSDEQLAELGEFYDEDE